jgi:hypothetical protein
MTYLISSTGLSARIHSLPGREPFMLAADLAMAYGTRTDAVSQAVRRNPDRFPEDFAFRLSEAETERLKTQNVLSNMANAAAPLAFTHAGALALSGVLKTPVAAQVSVMVHRTFAAMEQRAFAQMRAMVGKLRCDALATKPIYARVRMAAAEGLDIDRLWRMCSYPRWKLEEAVREMIELGLLDAPLAGMQPALFAPALPTEG